jgi:hypothetical protein
MRCTICDAPLFESLILGGTLCQRFACSHAFHVSIVRDVDRVPCDCANRLTTPLLPAA